MGVKRGRGWAEAQPTAAIGLAEGAKPAAGDVIVAVLLRQLSARAASLPGENPALPWAAAPEEMLGPSRALWWILHVAEVAEKEQQRGGVAARVWLEELSDVAQELDDLLDDLAVDGAAGSSHLAGEDGMGSPFHHWMVRLLSGFFLSPIPVPSARRVERRFRALKERLDRVAMDGKLLDLRGDAADGGPEMAPPSRETSSVMEEREDVIGREMEKKTIFAELFDRSGPRTRVISIVGLGGIGKTALARSIFNDESVKLHFELVCWVYVGEGVDIRRIMQKIIQGISKKACLDTSMESLHRTLEQILLERRSLVVLDDVWWDGQEDWYQLFDTLFRHGCRVLVTTRSLEVMNRTHSVLSVPLMPLSDKDCWKIFERYAFIAGDSHSYPILESTGRNIVRKLNGIPLAARILGIHLAVALEKEQWRSMLITADLLLAESVLPTLQISYRHLPSHLKLCFTYCCMFPKGHRFERRALVQMWMAQGFIPSVALKRIEDVGNDYFDVLLQMSFFQYNSDGYYMMPDLIHSLLQINSTGECLIIGDGKSYGDKNVRHVSFYYNGLEHFELQSADKLKKLRTLIYLHELSSVISDSVPCYLFGQLKCIRVLDLSHSEIKYLPDSVGNLKHLQYLDLSFTEIEDLPDSLCSLHNLQTLKLVEGKWHRLPGGLSNLAKLRYLDADAELFAGIAGIGKLTSLQELKIFNVYKESGHKIGELKGMKQLGGSLYIRNFDNIESGLEAAEAELMEKKHIVELKLE